MRTVHVGLLGFGKVGQAVARASVLGRDRLRARGVDLAVTRALVRDAARPRAPGSPPVALVADPDAFFRHRHDVIVEALGGVEPAWRHVTRALERGTPVVTANKSLVAARGEELQGIAARYGTSLRFEACALAGVPFIGALERRPLVASLTRLSAILNGTSNFILSAMARDHLPFGEALGRAQSLGLAEPDPSNDVQGVDAAEKLALLAACFGARGVEPGAIETTGIGALAPSDLAQAAAFGGAIKPVAYASFGDAFVDAFVGPAFVSDRHPLAAVSGRLNAIAIDGRFVDGLFFSGPGAGPDVTAATLLDDVVEAVLWREAAANGTPWRGPRERATCRAPITPWFVRFEFPSGAPNESALSELLAAHRVWLRRAAPSEHAGSHDELGAITHACSRDHLERGLEPVRAATGGATHAVRVLEN